MSETGMRRRLAVPVTTGTKITYKVGVGYPPAGVGCTAFNVHVGLQAPDGTWRDVCTIATLASGAPTTLCPTSVDYTVTVASRSLDGCDEIVGKHLFEILRSTRAKKRLPRSSCADDHSPRCRENSRIDASGSTSASNLATTN